MPRLDALVGLVDASLTAATGLLTLDSRQKGFPTSRVPMGIFIGTIGTIGTTKWVNVWDMRACWLR